jgi:hypothetical protein
MPLIDEIERLRQERLVEINAPLRDLSEEDARRRLEAMHGRVYDTQQLAAEFEVLGFMAPYVAVRRKADGIVGSLEFSHWPRFYFAFAPDRA